MDCLDWVGHELLSHVKEFKHLGILFTSEGRLEHQQVDQQLERCGGSSNVVVPDCRGEERDKPDDEALDLTYGHEL